LPNTHLLSDASVSAFIMYAAQYPVKYASKIVGNAYEFNQLVGYENYSILRDHFKFNTT